MSIQLINITKHYQAMSGRHTVYRNFNLTIPKGQNVGIIGHNGAGKSTLLKLISGVERPDEGRIVRDMSVSWPLGSTSFFHLDLSGTANAKFCARLYNKPVREVLDFVRDWSELGKFMDWPVKGYSTGMRSRLGFALSLAVKFDCILVDEVLSTGDIGFREKATRAVEALRARSSFVMVSHDLKTVSRTCDRVVVIKRGCEPIVSDDVPGTVKQFHHEMQRSAAS